MCDIMRDIMRVLPCTLLHPELRDYSLGQKAFAVFRALFAALPCKRL